MNRVMPKPATAAERDSSGKGLPLGFWLSLLIALVLAVVIGATGWLSWQNGQRAVVDLAGQLQARASKQVKEHLRGYLDAPNIAVEMIAGALESGSATPQDPDTMYGLMQNLARLYDGISYFNVGLDDGRFFGLGRVDNVSRELLIEETKKDDPGTLLQYGLAKDNTRSALRKSLPFGDFRKQVWYAEPLASGRSSWTSIYSWYENPEIVVIGFGKPVRLDNGERVAVVGIDLILANIDSYLAKLDVSPGSRVFIVERDGSLVSSSQSGTMAREPDGSLRRLHATDATDPLISSAARYLAGDDGGFAGVDEEHFGEFQRDGESFFVRVSPWRDELGLDWLIAVVVPEADFTTTINANLHATIALGAALMVLALIAVLLVTRYISLPVRRIESAAIAVARGDFSTSLPRSAFREFNQLSDAFHAMTRQLQAAFDQVEAAQAELEMKVTQRTEQLREANCELERLSQQDSLTGLANRRRFDPCLREELLRARRSGAPLSVVMCDIDFFKAYNDRYGHGPGDDVLVKVGRALQSGLRRPGDLAARYGGEEFALVLPNTNGSDALAILEHIRAELEAMGLVHEASPIGRITISFGVACHEAVCQFDSIEQILAAADRALYDAKAAGRDRVVVHGGELQPDDVLS